MTLVYSNHPFAPEFNFSKFACHCNLYQLRYISQVIQALVKEISTEEVIQALDMINDTKKERRLTRSIK